MTESKENLKKRIDTNKNQYIENNEVDNFTKDKKNGDIDLNNLGEYLNNLPLYNNDELKKALNNFFRSPERNKYDQTIKNKVTNNQPLDKTELSLMYLAMIAEPNKHLTQQQLKFDSNKPVDQICDGALIMFIRTKYNYPTYTGKKVKIDLPNETKKKTNSPIDKIQESKRGDTKLPENIGEIKESEADFYCDRLITRAEKNFANDIEKVKRELEQKHRYKNEEEKKAYIKRDTLLIAFSKYVEAINSQHEKHITNSGYKDKTDFENQIKLIEEFGKEIERKYPNINNILEKTKKFDEEMKANEKKYFKNENETKKAEKNYKEFNEYMDKKSKEYNIDKIQESLKKEPKTKEEMEEYLQTMNKIFEFQEDLNKKNKTYGGSISKYQNYIKGAIDIQKKYNIQQYQEILEKYNQDITNWNKKIDFKKYENYKNGLDWKLEVGLKNINTLQGIITDPDKNKNILVKEFKDVEDKQQIKQNGIDRIRERIKKFSPGAYWTLTTFIGLWNGLIDATLGVSTSLGVMILGIIGGTDETLSQMDRKARRDNFFKINQSSSQKESVYDSETGFNFNADNTVSTVSSSISQMLTLIYGGGAIGSGASKVLGISENIAGRVGLFTSSFITQVGGSYQEAITHGLTGKNAIGYSFLSATIQSSLELVSPNDVLLGKGNGITKELIRNACNEGGKQSFMLIGKTFLKNVGLEILEENIQEGLQTAAGNLINMVVNGTYGSKLGADWSWKNFASTAIITTLTTGITTGISTGAQMYEMSNQDQTKLIEHIKSDNGLYLEVTGMLDKAIEGKISIPNISIDQLQNLKLSLTGKGNINTPSKNTNVQTNYEIKISPEIEQISQILGSRFHEERKQSRLQSDGTYAPRVEKTSDQTWISQHNGQTEVDIANTHFEDLPSEWKSENLEAAKVAVGLIYDMVKNGEKVTSEMIEKMAEIVHNKRLERNGIEGSFENQRVPYEQLSESEKEKDRNQLLRAIETVKQGNTDYFDGKSHKIFEGNTGKAESNSNLSDRILSEINEQNKSVKLEELRKTITEQYEESTGEKLELSDEQLLSILDAHEQDGVLGELTLGQLRQKVKILSETITDPKIRRFLLEAGFCGKIEYTGNIDKMKELTNSSNELLNEINTIENYTLEIDKIYEVFRKEIYSLDRSNLDYNKVNDIIQKYNDINGKYDLIIDSLQKFCNKTTIRWQFKSLRDSINEGNYNITDSELTNLKNLEDYCYRLIEIKSNNLQQWATHSNSGINTMLSNLKTLANIDLSNGNNEIGEKSRRCDNLLYTIKRNAEYTKDEIHETYSDARQIQWKKEHEQQYKQDENSEIQTNNKSDYFNGKSHQFEVTETQARSNSENMDKILSEINEENKSEKLQELKNDIEQQYKQSTGEELQLSDEQLLSIIDAHEQDGILGELTLGQLRKKVKILDETIKDEKIRRFLLEFGFCGSRFEGILGTKNKIPQYQLNNSNNEKKLRYYQINEGVRIPRSNGSSTRAKITSYNQGIYTVEWSENGHIKAKELKQQEIDQENQLKMNPEEITRFNKYLPHVYRKGGLYPSHKINIGDGTTLYTTDKIVGKNSGRQYIIGYTFDNYGTMHLRQFYRSMSEGCWRACPGMREDGNLSKGEFITDSSYETTTKVDLSLGNTFDNLQQTYYNDFGPYNNYFSYSPISYIASSYKKNYILSDDMGPQNIYIRKLFPNLVGNDKTGHNKYNATDFYAGKYGHTIESVTKGYNNLIPEGLDYKNMKLNPNKSYSYHHEYLGNVNVQVCTIKRKGIDLDFHFARAINSPDKVWIENVACSDAQLNSWGVYNKQINAGPLVAKPVDYKEQCPNGGNIDQILPKVSPDYRDIRNLYQGNPIIKRFKQISK